MHRGAELGRFTHPIASEDDSEHHGPGRPAQGADGKTLEFKRELSGPDGLLKTVVAFANIAGGTLLLGVEDTGAVSPSRFGINPA